MIDPSTDVAVDFPEGDCTLEGHGAIVVVPRVVDLAEPSVAAAHLPLMLLPFNDSFARQSAP